MCVKNMLNRNVDITSPQTSWNVIIVYPTNSPPNVHVVDVITKGKAFQRRYFSLIPKVAINSHLPCSVTRPPACTCLRSTHVIIHTNPSTTLCCTVLYCIMNTQFIEGHTTDRAFTGKIAPGYNLFAMAKIQRIGHDHNTILT